MKTLDLDRLLSGLPKTWAGYLRDWDRTLRSANHPATTRYNYLLAAVQLARFLAAPVDCDPGRAHHNPTEVTRAQLEAFQSWMITTRSASTALNKHKSLQQFFKWLALDEEEIPHSPMDRVRQPLARHTLIPVISDADTKKILDTCKGRDFAQLRDQAIIRLLYNTGARLSEVAGVLVDEVDMNLDSILYHGKGGKDRRVRFGPRTARAISRYLRAREHHTGAEREELWLAERGGQPLTGNGIKLMLKRRGRTVGLTGVHAHRWRHSFAHEWKLAGGDTGDLMIIMGWSSEEMPRRYGASAASKRAQQVQARMGIGERV